MAKNDVQVKKNKIHVHKAVVLDKSFYVAVSPTTAKKGANIHLMYGPEGNSFVFPRVLMFSETKSRETSGLEGKQN